MDAEPLTGAYDAFFPGDAVFTSLGFSGGRGAVADEALLRLLERDVACVFVKDSLPWEPSEVLLAASRRRGVPLFRYGRGLLEQVITEARALIAEDAEADRLAEALRALAEMPCGPEAREMLREAAGIDARFVQAVVFSLEEGDSLAKAALCGQIRAGLEGVAALIARWEDGAVVLLGSETPAGALDAEGARQFIAGLGARPHGGLSEMLPASECPVALQEALAALEAARKDGAVAVCWSMLNKGAFEAARRAPVLLGRACAAGLDRLAAFDAETGGNLVESMEAYVACGGDVGATAERLFQHPNSVRNRLIRVRAVLAMEEVTDKELFAYLAMVFL